VQKIEELTDDDLRAMMDETHIREHRARALSPDHPVLRGSAQNPDVFFQARERLSPWYADCARHTQAAMDKFARIVGRQYHLFDYVGAPDAERVVVLMGSGAEAAHEAVDYLNARGERVGVLKVRLFRPFDVAAFVAALPATVKRLAVLDRTKEPGAAGEPLYQDVLTALAEMRAAGKSRFAVEPLVVGGRYGLSSKEFNPAMVKGVFDNLGKELPKNHFTVGIVDDVSHSSVEYDEDFSTEPDDVVRALFYGLGSDGTVGANKNSIKIIGDNTDLNAQAYFSYDSKKSGGITVSHLRFGKSSLEMPWLIDHADFVACHNPAYIGRYDMLGPLKKGGVFLLNSQIPSDEVFEHLTREMQEQIIEKKIRFYNINALEISEKAGLGSRINTVMQAAFFKISEVLPEAEAIDLVKQYVKKTFLKKGEDIVKQNWAAIDGASDALHQVVIPAKITKSYEPARLIPADADDFAKDIMEPIMHLKGNDIPVSKMSFDGTLPTGTAKFEKRGVAPFVPHWIAENCIQCNQCVQSCPHAAIRAKQIDPKDLEGAPETFKTLKSNTKNTRNLQFKIQIYTEDCQGCGVCIETCPSKVKSLEFSPIATEREAGEIANAEFFEALPYDVLDGAPETSIKGLQFKQPLFEFSGACAGCGETPYVKMVSQICGDRMIVANATGCSSIYSGTFPTTPYTVRQSDGHGPAWGNSLFEDNAEYGLGMRLAVDSNRKQLRIYIDQLFALGTTEALKSAIEKSLELWEESSEAANAAQKAVQAALVEAMAVANAEQKAVLAKIDELKDYFADKVVFIIGGDGWAYDIGYGGVDHVIASGRNVNILVLDTEVYSNTGGQASKSTPIAAVAKFANAGKEIGKKNMGFMCMTYGHAYVASIALGSNRLHAQKALQEAVAWKGPSIIFCYSPCINHGMNMRFSQVEEKKAVEAGYWPLYRFNPALEEGKRFSWDAKPISGSFQDFIKGEVRYTSLYKTNPENAEDLFAKAEEDAHKRWSFFEKLGPLM